MSGNKWICFTEKDEMVANLQMLAKDNGQLWCEGFRQHPKREQRQLSTVVIDDSSSSDEEARPREKKKVAKTATDLAFVPSKASVRPRFIKPCKHVCINVRHFSINSILFSSLLWSAICLCFFLRTQDALWFHKLCLNSHQYLWLHVTLAESHPDKYLVYPTEIG